MSIYKRKIDERYIQASFNTALAIAADPSLPDELKQFSLDAITSNIKKKLEELSETEKENLLYYMNRYANFLFKLF